MEKENIELRKQNYWRGFRACVVLVVIPGAIAFVVFCNAIIKIME